MSYTKDDIISSEFGKACRMRIGMYLSGDRHLALLLGLREIITNSQDEYENGHGNKIEIEINSDNRILSVVDNASGIPFGIRKDGIDAMLAACTIQHTGAKMETNVYSSAAGLNGTGLKVVCHTSDWMEATSTRDGYIHKIIFKGSDNGAVLESMTDTKYIGKNTGTSIKYIPSKDVYGDEWINKEELYDLITNLTYLAKGLTITVDFDGDKKTFISKNGLLDALSKKKAVHKNPLYYCNTIDNIKIELALQWCRGDADLRPYANNLHVYEGGPFMTGFKTSLTKSFNAILGTEYSGDVIRKYLDGYVSVKVTNPDFSNQSKTALTNPEARTPCSQAIATALKEFFTKYPKDAEDIKELLDRETKAERAAERAREAEKAVATGAKKPKMISNLPAKLADANAKTGDKELFIVEGDSAAGNLKKLRNAQMQGVLPLRGKILNCFSKDLADVIKNEEIKGLITTLGCGAGSTIDTKKLRYNRIIIASDAK